METATNVHAIPTNNETKTEELPVSPNAMATLSYFMGIAAIVALVMRDYQKNAYVRFSAIQALLFQGTWVVGYIAIAILTGIFSSMVSLVLGSLKLYSLVGILVALPTLASLAFTLTMLATWITLMVTASQGKQLKLPVLGKFATQIANR